VHATLLAAFVPSWNEDAKPSKPAAKKPVPSQSILTKDEVAALKGVGVKAGGKYTPPAILRAVANAARNKDQKSGAGGG
jgi:hypothetical protein